MLKTRLSLRFGTPHHGWLDVVLERRELEGGALDTHAVDASDVPCDSLAQLAAAARSLLEGHDRARVEWSLEPAYDVWLFRRTGNADLVELQVGTERPRAPQRFAVLPAAEVARALWRGLRRLESDPVWRSREASDAWSWGFPSDEVAALGKKLGDDLETHSREPASRTLQRGVVRHTQTGLMLSVIVLEGGGSRSSRISETFPSGQSDSPAQRGKHSKVGTFVE